MIEITPEQMAALDEVARERFLDRLVPMVAPSEHVERDPETVRRRCDVLMREAGAFGFQSERGVASYVLCAWEIGDDFARRDDLPFAAILAAPGVLEAKRSEQLLGALERETPSPRS